VKQPKQTGWYSLTVYNATWI